MSIKKQYIPAPLASAVKDGYVTDASEILDDAKGKRQSIINQETDSEISDIKGGSTKSIANLDNEINGNGGIDERLGTVEQLAEISIGGGDAQIATGEDFTNPDATKRAKVPTVGAVLDGMNDGVYDVSKRNPTGGENSDGKFTLEYILANANTLIPTSRRHGGMIISFVSIVDHKYVQFRCKTQSFSLDPEDWYFEGDETLEENPEFISANIDNEGILLEARKIDGTKVEFGDLEIKGSIKNQELIEQLDSKVDKEEGKSLIDADFASLQEFVESPEFIEVETDNEGRILGGYDVLGKKILVFPTNQDDLLQKQIDNIPALNVDDELSSSSTNPVQNRVIKTALDGKATLAEVGNIVADYVNNTISGQVEDYLHDHIEDFQVVNPNVSVISSLAQLQALSSSDNNRIFSIQTNIDLNNNTIDLVSQGALGITLQFDGGVISNGAITPNNTKCIFNTTKAFSDVTINGRFNVEEVDVRCLGALCNGVDGGIADFTYDDAPAINEAVKFAPKVIIPYNTVSVIKTPILLQSNTELSVKGTLLLGKGANCQMVITPGVLISNDGKGNVTYPADYKRAQNIVISGGGIFDGNSEWQNWGNTIDPPYYVKEELLNTPLHWSRMASILTITDVDYLEIKDIRLKNSTCYQGVFGGVTKFKVHDIVSDRSYFKAINVFFQFHGNCYDGEIYNLSGISGDDVVALTSMEQGSLSERVGNIKRIYVHDLTIWGIHPDATPNNPIEMDTYDGMAEGYQCRQVIRVSYVDETISDIVFENIKATAPVNQQGSPIVLSNLPYKNINNGRDGYGNGKIGNISFRNIVQTDSYGLIDTSDYVNIDSITIQDICENRTRATDKYGLLFFKEAFLPSAAGTPITTAEHSEIKNLTINNYVSYKGSTSGLTLPNGYINWEGIIDRLVINNFKVIPININVDKYALFAHIKCGELFITNSDLSWFTAPFSLLNTDGILFENNNLYGSGSLLNQQTARAITNTLVMVTEPTSPQNGDVIRKSDGIYQYKNNNWV